MAILPFLLAQKTAAFDKDDFIQFVAVSDDVIIEMEASNPTSSTMFLLWRAVCCLQSIVMALDDGMMD